MIDLFFQLLNFGIVVGLIAYGTVRFFIPVLKKGVDAENMVAQNLHDEHHQLVIDQKIVDEDTVIQETDCIGFFNKINSWKSSVKKEMEHKAAERRHMKEESEKKLRLQSYQHSLNLMYKKVAPSVVKGLEKELMEYFSDEKRGQSYIDRLLKSLKSEV
jgi:hypothetical protein